MVLAKWLGVWLAQGRSLQLRLNADTDADNLGLRLIGETEPNRSFAIARQELARYKTTIGEFSTIHYRELTEYPPNG